jgi:hypothetical protein
MICEELKVKYDRISGSWPDDVRAFSIMLLVVIDQLEHQFQKFEDQIVKNSHYSSKPSSSDLNRLVKWKNRVIDPNHNPGVQCCHKGQGGKLKATPDNILSFNLTDSPYCGHILREVAVDETLHRQFEDISPIKMVVTEYQTEEKTCLVCITRWQAGGCAQQHEFEFGQWGRELVEALHEDFNLQLSTSKLNNNRRASSNQLDEFIAGLKQAPTAYFYETGKRFSGDNHLEAGNNFALEFCSSMPRQCEALLTPIRVVLSVR